MAADILIFGGQLVPVGQDQLQHLELARTIVRKFNNKFGQTFAEPKPLLTATSRVMSLDDPSKKMSKSRPEGCLFIDDSPEEIKRKVSRAVTDSGKEVKFDEQNKPAISNLLKIYSDLSGKEIKDLEQKFSGKNYSEFKNSLADIIIDSFNDFRKKKVSLLKKQGLVRKTINSGSVKAKKIASAKMKEVRSKLGLI